MRIPYSPSVVLLFSSRGIHIKSGSKNIYNSTLWEYYSLGHMEYYNGYFNFISYFSYFSHKELCGCDIMLFQSAVTSSAMFGNVRQMSRIVAIFRVDSFVTHLRITIYLDQLLPLGSVRQLSCIVAIFRRFVCNAVQSALRIVYEFLIKFFLILFFY